MSTGIYVTRSVINIALVYMVNFGNETDADLGDVEVESISCPAQFYDFIPQSIYLPSSSSISKGKETMKNTPLREYSDNLSSTKYEWDPSVRAYIQSAFFLGYLFLQIPAASLANKYGGKLFVMFSVLLSAILTLIGPSIAYNEWFFIISRIVLGVAQSCYVPACFVLLVNWLPLKNRSLGISCLAAASNVGQVMIYFVSGFIIKFLGWPYLFWLGGLYALVVGFFSSFFLTSNPQNHLLITDDELNEIRIGQTSLLTKYKSKYSSQASLLNSTLDQNGNVKSPNFRESSFSDNSQVKPNIPWLKMFKNRPFLAAFFYRVLHSSVGMLNFNFLPLFFRSVLGLSPELNGIMCASVSALTALGSVTSAIFSEKIIEKKFLIRTNVRKLFCAIDGFGRAICLFFIPLAIYYGQTQIVLALVVISSIMSSMIAASESSIPAEMSKNFGHTIFAILNVCAMVSGIIVPNLVSMVLKAYGEDLMGWYIIYFAAGAVSILGTIPFLIWGSADRQEFDFPSQSDQTDRARAVSVESFVYSVGSVS